MYVSNIQMRILTNMQGQGNHTKKHMKMRTPLGRETYLLVLLEKEACRGYCQKIVITLSITAQIGKVGTAL